MPGVMFVRVRANLDSQRAKVMATTRFQCRNVDPIRGRHYGRYVDVDQGFGFVSPRGSHPLWMCKPHHGSNVWCGDGGPLLNWFELCASLVFGAPHRVSHVSCDFGSGVELCLCVLHLEEPLRCCKDIKSETNSNYLDYTAKAADFVTRKNPTLRHGVGGGCVGPEVDVGWIGPHPVAGELAGGWKIFAVARSSPFLP